MHGKSLSGVVERNYQFQRQLYRYVEAELWEATHLTQHNTYWILAFDSYLSEKPERYNVLRRSMESFAPLQHPHLLGISEFWEGAGGRLFVALSHLPNAMPLYELRGQLAPGEIQFIFSELVALIEWTHDWGIVLDLRPDQIFLRQRPFAFRYLLLPKQDSIAVLRTQPDIARVDSRYLSPEEVEGWPQTKASAYFTLGTILFETLTGQDAFLADTALSTLEMIRSGRSPAIEQAALDPGMRSLLEHLMQPNPEYRLKDSQIVREHIQSVLGRGAAWSPQGSADASLVAVPKVEEDMFDDHTAISDGEGFGGASHASVDWLSPPLGAAPPTMPNQAKSQQPSQPPLFQTPGSARTPSSTGAPEYQGTGAYSPVPAQELTAVPASQAAAAPAPFTPSAPPPSPAPAMPAGGGGMPPTSYGGGGYGGGGDFSVDEISEPHEPALPGAGAPVFSPYEEAARSSYTATASPSARPSPRAPGAMALRDDELQRHLQEGAYQDQVKVLRRKGVVRHFSQMNPGKVFPLLVSIVEAELYIKIPDLANVQQVESDKILEIKETSPLVRLVPVIPGCIVSPPEAVVDVRRPKIDVTFWIAPQAEGDFRRSARVEVWHDGVCQDAIPLPCMVRTQTFTKIASGFSIVSSVSGAFLEAFVGQGKALAAPGASLAEGSWAAELAKKFVALLSTSGLWLGLFFLVTAFLSYLWLKPRQGDVIERFLNNEIH